MFLLALLCYITDTRVLECIGLVMNIILDLNDNKQLIITFRYPSLVTTVCMRVIF